MRLREGGGKWGVRWNEGRETAPKEEDNEEDK